MKLIDCQVRAVFVFFLELITFVETAEIILKIELLPNMLVAIHNQHFKIDGNRIVLTTTTHYIILTLLLVIALMCRLSYDTGTIPAGSD